MHDIFIAYVEEDAAWAERVCRALEARDMLCWIARRDVLPSEDRDEAIVRAMDAAKAAVAIVSGAASRSEFFYREVVQLFANDLPVGILRVDQTVLTGALGSQLAVEQHFDATDDPDGAIERFVEYMRIRLSRDPPTGAQPIDARETLTTVGQVREAAGPAFGEGNSRYSDVARLTTGQMRAMHVVRQSLERRFVGEAVTAAPMAMRSMPIGLASSGPTLFTTWEERTRRLRPLIYGIAIGLLAANSHDVLSVFRGAFESIGAWALGALKLIHSSMAAPPSLAVTDQVDVAAFAPSAVGREQHFLVQVLLYTPQTETYETLRLARMADASTIPRGVRTLSLGVRRGTRLTVAIEAPGVELLDPSYQTLVWEGRIETIQFLAKVPEGTDAKAVSVRIRVLDSTIPIAQLLFTLAVEAHDEEPVQRAVGSEERHFRRAFLSYSREDAAEVLKRAQGIRAAGVDLFQDFVSLQPGEGWEDRIHAEIQTCDLFLLFWSGAARRSPWVAHEIELALNARQRASPPCPEIIPVMLEGPPPPSPPSNLSHLQFDDPICYFIAAQHIKSGPPMDA